VVLQGWPSGNGSGPPRAIAVDLQGADGPKEYLIDDGTWVPGAFGVGHICVDGDIILSVAAGRQNSYLTLTSLVTGERKLVWAVPGGTGGTALALPYAYGLAEPEEVFVRFDTRNGQVKTSLKAGTCEFVSGTSTGLGACASAGVGLDVVDFDHNSASLIANTGYQQTNGMLSQDGKDAVWIDFRDPGPNGEHGSYDSPWGGEVYHKTLGATTDDRLTFDTPSSPHDEDGAMGAERQYRLGHDGWL